MPRAPARTFRPAKPPHESTRPPPVGPLARVPSNPSFVPSFVIDLDAVASRISERVGAVHTAQELLQSLDTAPATGPSAVSAEVPKQAYEEKIHSFSYPPERVIRSSDDLWESTQPPDFERYGAPLEVVVAKEDASMFSEEALVLKIRSQEHHQGPSDLSDAEKGLIGNDLQDPDAATDGFAINIPVTKDPDPFGNDGPSSWELSSPLSEGDPDEEDPLFLEETGLDMSHRPGNLPVEGQAFVQRYGARNVASEQEVLFAVNAEKLGSRTTGLFLPVMDSKDDLKQLMFIHPPTPSNAADEEDPLVEDSFEPTATTAEGAREYVKSLTKKIPPLADMESTLEVHGTAKNATVAISVKNRVSVVGYIVLAIALVSVASQGTAVKWLPSVDGLITATWLMQTQTLIMLPFALFQYLTMNKQEHEDFRKRETWRRILLASLSQVCWAAGFFIAVDHTSLFHAWALNNVHALLIVLFVVIRRTCLQDKGVRISEGEVTGARVALLGVAVMQLPALLQNDNGVIGGDLVAACGSLGAIAFLGLCKTLRSQIPLFLMMTPITALNGLLLSLGSAVVNGTDFSISDHGALGWLRNDRIVLGLYLGGVIGFLGTVCCIAALKFLPSVVVGSVQTMMPVAGTLVAVVAGVDTLPDFWTTLGGGVLLYGVLNIAKARQETEDVVVLNADISEVGTAQGVS